MVARVSPEAVKEVIPTNISDDILETNLIDTANAYVDEVLADSDLSTRILKKIELYLAAHFVALTQEKGGLTRNKIGDADASYANVYSGGLHLTRFGQTALALDTTGLLAASQTALKAEFRVV